MDTGSLAFQVLSCKKTTWPTETEREGERLIQNRKRVKFSLKCDDHMATTLGVNPLNPHRSNSPSAEVKLNNKKHGPL